MHDDCALIPDIFKNGLKSKRKTEKYNPNDEELVTGSSEAVDIYEGKQIWLKPDTHLNYMVQK